MKKLMMMMAMMVAAVTANAQQMFVKPMVGATVAKITDADDAAWKIGIAAGGEFGYLLNEQFAVTAGALVSMQGTKDSEDDDYSMTTTYLNVPILANYYIIPGLAVKAGVQPGFLLSAKSKGEVHTGSGWAEYDHSGTDGYKKFDLSIPLGLSYEISDFVIDARYNLGLTNINDDSNVKNKNSVIMLTVGYKIPF